jgi:hypothetical protein
MKLVQDFLGLPYWAFEPPPHETSYTYAPMNPAVKRQLEAFFEPHNQRLYEHLGVDFGW